MATKTIFISSFHTLISRNIVRTPVISTLLENSCRIVLLVPNSKLEYFEKEFASSTVSVEGVPTGASVRTKRVGILKRLAEALPNTNRAGMGRKLNFTGSKKSFFYYFCFYLPAGFLGKSILAMRLLRQLDYFLSPRGRFYALFEKYKPDLVFSTDVQNEHDVSLMQDARKRNIPVVGMVRSWDNVVTRAFRSLPETLIVHNDIIKQQAMSLYGVSPDRILVTGIPHYDRYLKGPTEDRTTFFTNTALDETKKTVLFFPLCDYRIVHDTKGSGNVYTDRVLLEALTAFDGNVIVRFPPNETVTVEGFVKPKNFFYDRPGIGFGREAITTRELTALDDDHLINELVHADIVVCGPSTVAIDAAIFDRPIIFINFSSGSKSVGRIFEYQSEHIQNLLKTGGARIAENREDLLNYIRQYSAHPSRDASGRRQIVEEQCYKLDGKASSRVADIVLKALATHS